MKGLLAGLVVCALLVAGLLVSLTPNSEHYIPMLGCGPGSSTTPIGTPVAVGQNRVGITRAILEIGDQLEASPRAKLAGVLTALQESGMRPGITEAESDADSAGLMQQRRHWLPTTFPHPPAPDYSVYNDTRDDWINADDPRLDPEWAIRTFYTGINGMPGALEYDTLGRKGSRVIRTAGNLADAVQGSAYPEAYDNRMDEAQDLIRQAIGSSDAAAAQPVNTTVQGGQGSWSAYGNPFQPTGAPTGEMVKLPDHVSHNAGSPWWNTGTWVDTSIAAQAIYLAEAFGLSYGDGYAEWGHSSSGEHPLGLAVDIVPGAGTWDDVDRLAFALEPTQNQVMGNFRWIGYDGDSNHGRGHHLHISWNRNGGTTLPGFSSPAPVTTVNQTNCGCGVPGERMNTSEALLIVDPSLGASSGAVRIRDSRDLIPYTRSSVAQSVYAVTGTRQQWSAPGWNHNAVAITEPGGWHVGGDSGGTWSVPDPTGRYPRVWEVRIPAGNLSGGSPIHALLPPALTPQLLANGEYWNSYSLRLGPGFEFNGGSAPKGKLGGSALFTAQGMPGWNSPDPNELVPGLDQPPAHGAGERGVRRGEGFSARLMWSGNRLHTYSYDPAWNAPGHNHHYGLEQTMIEQLQAGEWYDIAVRVVFSSSAHADDGRIEWYVNGRLTQTSDGLNLHPAGTTSSVGLYHETYFGGGNEAVHGRDESVFYGPLMLTAGPPWGADESIPPISQGC